MDKIYEKTIDGQLKEIDPNPTEATYTLKALRFYKTRLLAQKNKIQVQIDENQALIDKCRDLNVPEEVIVV